MLKKNYEFRKVLSNGKFFYGKFVNAVIMDNGKNFNFLGLALSSKLGKAVKRNRMKRLIRESYYFFEQDIKIGKSIVFLWNKNVSAENINFFDIKSDMKNIFGKAKILK